MTCAHPNAYMLSVCPDCHENLCPAKPMTTEARVRHELKPWVAPGVLDIAVRNVLSVVPSDD